MTPPKRKLRPSVRPASGGYATALPASATRSEGLAAISFCLGRAYYNYVGLLERTLRATGLDRHLRPGMGQILFALFEQDDCIIKQIAERVELSPSTLTGMLQRMERAGIIETRRDESDGRAVRIRLTRLGRSLRERCRTVLQTVTRVLSADMTAAEVDAVKHGLQRMVAAMRVDEQQAQRRVRKLVKTAGGTR